MTSHTPDPLQAVADGLRQRVRELIQAEDQLARFAFSERPGGPERSSDTPSWQHFTSRAMSVAGDREAMELLRRLASGGPATIADLGTWLDAGRLAVVDRLNQLSHIGCVSRDLETDRVTVTQLGEALVSLVEEISRRAAAS